MTRRWMAGWMAGLLAAGVAASGSANMLSNGAMNQAPIFNDQDGWEAFSNNGDPNFAVWWADWANGGGLSLFNFWGQEGDGDYGFAFACWQATSGGFYQDNQIQSNKTYTFTIWSHTGCNAIPSAFTNHQRRIDFEWFSGDPDTGAPLVAITTNDITSQIVNGQCDPSGPGDAFNWQYFEFTNITPPPGARWMRIVVKFDSFGQTATGGSEAIRWDSARLAVSSLDPTNPTTTLSTNRPMWYFDFFTQSNVLFSLQFSTNLPANTWIDTAPDPLPGNWQTQRVYHLPQGDSVDWRVWAERE